MQDRLFVSDFDRTLQQLDATALVRGGDERGRTHTVNVVEKSSNKSVGRNKEKDKGNP